MKTKKIPNILKIVGWGIVILFLLLATGELTTRILKPRWAQFNPWSSFGQLYRKSNDLILKYELKGEANVYLYGILNQTNAEGFRDAHSYSSPKHGKEKRVVILGDSLTYGIGIQIQDLFSKRLEALLNNANPHQKPTWEVFNLGVCGYGMEQELQLLATKGLKFSPDLILVVYNLNDPIEYSGELPYVSDHSYPYLIWGPWEEKLSPVLEKSWLYRSLRYLALRQTTEGQLKTRLDQAIKEAKELKNKGGLSLWEQCRILAQNLDTDKKVWREISWIPAIYDAPDIQTKLSSYFQDLAKVHRDTGVPVILIIAPALVDFTSYPLSPVHAFIHSLADKAKLPSCDLLDWFKKLGIKNVAFWGVDYMHLSPDGHQVVAAILQETLKPYKKSLENKEE